MAVPYDDLDPGIRQVVRWLNDNSFVTTDSGDGVSKPHADEVLDVPHVSIRCEAETLVQVCDQLTILLREAGVEPSPMTEDVVPGAVHVQGFYDPSVSQQDAFILLLGLNDEGLPPFDPKLCEESAARQ